MKEAGIKAKQSKTFSCRTLRRTFPYGHVLPQQRIMERPARRGVRAGCRRSSEEHACPQPCPRALWGCHRFGKLFLRLNKAYHIGVTIVLTKLNFADSTTFCLMWTFLTLGMKLRLSDGYSKCGASDKMCLSLCCKVSRLDFVLHEILQGVS